MQIEWRTDMPHVVRVTSALRFIGITTTACGLACFTIQTVLAKDPCLIYRPRTLTRSSRCSVTQILQREHTEALVLAQTLWNHHFEQDSAELRASGRAHLDRLARRYPFGNLEVSIQSAHDFRFTDDDHEAYFKHRRDLDAARTKAVADYLQKVLPQNAVAIHIHDRPPVGISGNEALKAYRQMVSQANVTIPDDSTGSRSLYGVGQNTGAETPGFGNSETLSSMSEMTLPEFGSDTPVGPDTTPEALPANDFPQPMDSTSPDAGSGESPISQ
jgi:hypothetical protein